MQTIVYCVSSNLPQAIEFYFFLVDDWPCIQKPPQTNLLGILSFFCWLDFNLELMQLYPPSCKSVTILVDSFLRFLPSIPMGRWHTAVKYHTIGWSNGVAQWWSRGTPTVENGVNSPDFTTVTLRSTSLQPKSGSKDQNYVSSSILGDTYTTGSCKVMQGHWTLNKRFFHYRKFTGFEGEHDWSVARYIFN